MVESKSVLRRYASQLGYNLAEIDVSDEETANWLKNKVRERRLAAKKRRLAEDNIEEEDTNE